METEDYLFMLKTSLMVLTVLLVILGFYQILKKVNLRNAFRTHGYDDPYWKRYHKRERK